MTERKDGFKDREEHFVKNWPYCHNAKFAKENFFSGVTGKNHPNAGMSRAVFEILASKKVRIMGGSMTYGWTFEQCHGDNHYSFRMVRTTVLDKCEAKIEGIE